jgi:ribA/ribD-fused uncharacterized protein
MISEEIKQFKGRYSFLSNFWYCPIYVEEDTITYRTVEHAYQAAKCVYTRDKVAILACEKPGEAKRMGRNVEIVSGWEDMKLDVMLRLLRIKFAIPYLRKSLLATGDFKLIEGNYWGDTFWGVDLKTGKGENHLGELLMLVRNDVLGMEEKKPKCVSEVIDQLICFLTSEDGRTMDEVREDLIVEGIDPDRVIERGRKLVEKKLDELKNRRVK